MRRRLLPLLTLLLASASCAAVRSFPPIPPADEVQAFGLEPVPDAVRNAASVKELTALAKKPVVIRDPETVDALRALGNANLSFWWTPLDTYPSAARRLVFYAEGEPVGGFKLGSGFLSRRDPAFFMKRLSSSEVAEFERLLGGASR